MPRPWSSRRRSGRARRSRMPASHPRAISGISPVQGQGLLSLEAPSCGGRTAPAASTLMPSPSNCTSLAAPWVHPKETSTRPTQLPPPSPCRAMRPVPAVQRVRPAGVHPQRAGAREEGDHRGSVQAQGPQGPHLQGGHQPLPRARSCACLGSAVPAPSQPQPFPRSSFFRLPGAHQRPRTARPPGPGAAPHIL